MAKFKRYAALILALALIFAVFTGCAEQTGENAETEKTEEEHVEGESLGMDLPRAYAADDVFSLDSDPDAGYNPIKTKSSKNLLFLPLVYDNVFELDENFNVSSRIVTEYNTDNGIWWTFDVDTSVRFHDGSTLTAYDVAYSIKQAMQSSRYSPRLSCVWGCSALDEDTFAITLAYENMQLPSVFTVPVIKDGSAGDDIPPGTGPFMFSEELDRLEIFRGNPSAACMPIRTIYLVQCDGVEESIEAYKNGITDAVINDPSSIADVGYGTANDIWTYPTTSMHYIGFNMSDAFLCYANYRYALNFAVDREYIAKNVMGGNALPAALPISPMSSLYNTAYAENFGFSLEKCATVFYNSNVRDVDDDGKLEYMLGGIPIEIDIDFVVCSDSSEKLEIARSIAANLAGLGVTVTIRELGWNDYVTAIMDGEYDMYYGEIKLTPDFNLRSLLTENGTMNYGGIEDPNYETKILEYLKASDEERNFYCDMMCKYIADTAPIVPICFEKQQLLTHRGVVSGVSPTQYNAFNGFADWEIDLGG